MHLPRRLLALLYLLPRSSSALFATKDTDLEVISNPHSDVDHVAVKRSAALDGLLEPYQLIVQPLLTQPDTFQELVYHTVLTVPVPVYRMKQPARLSARQLEFDLILVRKLGSDSAASTMVELPVDRQQAMDSWFPGFYWTPLIIKCNNNDDSRDWKHVGWKFTANDVGDTPNTQAAALPHFYALMVHVNDEEKIIGGVRMADVTAQMVAAAISYTSVVR